MSTIFPPTRFIVLFVVRKKKKRSFLIQLECFLVLFLLVQTLNTCSFVWRCFTKIQLQLEMPELEKKNASISL